MSQGIFHRTRFNRIFRYSALTLAALAVAGQLFGVVHLALVQHVTCEHGELVEAGAGSLSSVTPVNFSTAAVQAAPAEGHGHDHCLIALARRQQARSTTARPTQLGLAPATGANTPAGQSFSIAPIDILFVAPKNSPPV